MGVPQQSGGGLSFSAAMLAANVASVPGYRSRQQYTLLLGQKRDMSFAIGCQ